MKTICAWCGKLLADDATAGGMLSHGICGTCKAALLGEHTIGLAEFLGRIAVPVVALDGDAVVLGANRAAEGIMGKPAAQIHGQRSGVAIDCANASLPGGCGQSAYCQGCALRKTIAATHADGQPRYGIVSEHPIMADGGTQKTTRFRVSTTKTGDVVLLAFEDAKGQRNPP